MDIPSVVPPTTFKPVLSREQLRVWAKADEALAQADAVVIVGYSFAQADEHFNDLLRKSAASVTVVARRPEVAWSRAARVLGIEAKPTASRDGRVFRHGRLRVVRGQAESLSAKELAELF